jgi:hypothetical protein
MLVGTAVVFLDQDGAFHAPAIACGEVRAGVPIEPTCRRLESQSLPEASGQLCEQVAVQIRKPDLGKDQIPTVLDHPGQVHKAPRFAPANTTVAYSAGLRCSSGVAGYVGSFRRRSAFFNRCNGPRVPNG